MWLEFELITNNPPDENWLSGRSLIACRDNILLEQQLLWQHSSQELVTEAAKQGWFNLVNRRALT